MPPRIIARCCKAFLIMTRLLFSFIAIVISGCSNSFRTVGLVNNSDNEVTIETSPNIRYNGLPEKYIGLEKDSSSRGLVWKFGPINCIIIRPLGPQPAYDSIGKYIMKPKSGFEIGNFYKPSDVDFNKKCIDLNYLKIITVRDTMTFTDKDAIWKAINYDKKIKRNRMIFYDKAVVLN